LIKKFEPLRYLAHNFGKNQKKIRMKQLEQLAEKKKKYQEEAKNILKDCLRGFMLEHSNITAIAWVQYTPFFNDGDECVFGMHDMHFSAKKPFTDEDAKDFSGFDDEIWYQCPRTYDYSSPYDKTGYYDRMRAAITKEESDAINALNKTLHGLAEEMKIVFGDHVKVVVTQNGVLTFEYNHD
jgi:hypothetical protein